MSSIGQTISFDQTFRCTGAWFGCNPDPRRREPGRVNAEMSQAKWIALIWLGIGLANGTQIVVGMRAVGMQHNWGALFFVWTAAWLVWACATPLVLEMGRRLPLVRTSAVRNSGWQGSLAHLGACLAISVADAVWIGLLYHLLNPFGGNPPSWWHAAFSMFYERLVLDLITYAAILAGGYAMDSLRHLAQREAELSNARLEALQRQIEPHLLFNTLNSIAGLVREQRNSAAVAMIAGLGDLLRRLLDGGARQLVPLAEELSFLERYVEINTLRFGARLNVTVEVPIELSGALVPSLVLQPLIENAIVHGIAKREEGGSIRVTASENHGELILSVHNDGPGLPAEGASERGVGIANTRGRLKTLYGGACELLVRNHAVEGVETVVRLPWRTE
jgi:two-component system LytT family sensor kinase